MLRITHTETGIESIFYKLNCVMPTADNFALQLATRVSRNKCEFDENDNVWPIGLLR